MKYILFTALIACAAGCAGPGSAEAAAANAFQKQQLSAVRKDVRKIVNAYDADLRAAYQLQADLILESELRKAAVNGQIAVDQVPALLAQAREVVQARFNALEQKRKEFEENENLEDAILLNDAEGAWIRAVDAAWSDVQNLIGRFGRKKRE